MVALFSLLSSSRLSEKLLTHPLPRGGHEQNGLLVILVLLSVLERPPQQMVFYDGDCCQDSSVGITGRSRNQSMSGVQFSFEHESPRKTEMMEG